MKVYRNYDIFINTSEFDNFPMSIVEAGLNGLLCISSEAKGIKALYDNSEILFFRNPEQLESLISNSIINYNSYIPHRINLQNKVRNFNWMNVKDKWLNALNEACK